MGSFLETYNLCRVWRLNLKGLQSGIEVVFKSFLQIRFDNGFYF